MCDSSSSSSSSYSYSSSSSSDYSRSPSNLRSYTKLPRFTWPINFMPLKAYVHALLLCVVVYSALGLVVVRAGTCREQTAIYTRNFTQVVDHFDSQNPDTFHQRFWEQKRWWKTPQQEGQYVFLRINSFQYQPGIEMENSTLALWAEQMGALMYEIEPRYTPCSSPVGDFATIDLKYYSIEQILADFIAFIANRTEELQLLPGTRWIVLGELYNGAFATWLRAKPNLTFGSISLSPQLLATSQYTGYDDAYQKYLGPQCASVMHDAITTLSNFFMVDNATTQAFQLQCGCSFPLPASEFMYVASTILIGSLDYEKDFICSNLTAMVGNGQSAILNNLANLIAGLNYLPCEEWDFALDNGTHIGNSNADFRPTYYLECTQLGQFETPSNSSTSLLPMQMNLDWYLGVCHRLFANIPAKPPVDLVNSNFGGNNPKGCNMIFVNSVNDPYAGLGPNLTNIVLNSPTTGNQVVTMKCPSTSSIFDVLSPPTPYDDPCLVNTRQQIVNILVQWQKQESSCGSQGGQGSGGSGGGSGNDDDAGNLALVGTLTGVFGIGIGIVIGLAVFYWFSRPMIRRYIRAARAKRESIDL
jgi:hypothetical protein